MKKIKFCSCLIVLLALLIGTFFLNRKEDYCYYLAIGDYISNDQTINDYKINSFSNLLGEYLKEEKVVNEVNVGYLKNNMTSKKMLEMIEKGSFKTDDSNLNSIIKKSKYITITLGINDVINLIKYDSHNNKLIYDKDVIANKVEVFKHNYHNIIEQIKEINPDTKIILVGCYAFYGDKEIAALINDATQKVSEETDSYYVDITSIKDKYMYQENELYLTSLGQHEIYNRVVLKIEEIESI